MPIEAATYISQLNSSYPPGTDDRSTADDHLRLIKAVLQAQFPSLGAAAVNATAAELNALAGLSAVIDTFLGAANEAAARAAIVAMQDVITTRGDLVRGNSSGDPEQLAIGTTGKILRAATDPSWDDAIKAATVGAVSGTTISITGIPSWAKRVTVVIADISTNGTSPFKLLLGHSGGLEGTGYYSFHGYYSTSGQSVSSSTDSFKAVRGSTVASTSSQTWTLVNVSGNTWVASMVGNDDGGSIISSQGTKTLTGTLTQLQLTTVSGDTFDAGSINAYYE